MARCKEKVGKVRCIVPVNEDGAHIDGNPVHYNGSSHHVKDTWTRG